MLQQLGFYGSYFSGIPYPSPTAVGAAGVPATGTGAAATNGSTADAGSSNTDGSGSSGPLATSAGTSGFSELALVRESETLKIQTVDGAQVTIQFGAGGAGFAGSAALSDGSLSTTAAIFSSERLSVSVRGNLTNDDLQAIGNVLTQVDALATQFFSGDTQAAFAAAANIGTDPSEIAGFSLSASYSSALYQVASTPSSDAAGASKAPSDATPQQTISTYIQNVMSKLGRSSGSGQNATLSARWKIHLLAEALPMYAQTQAGAATTSPGSGSTTQAAKLAAAALHRLAA